jgi:hypothetical protein
VLHGLGRRGIFKLNDSIYWRDSDGLYVNLFIPSELDWTDKGFRLRQETKYPESQTTTTPPVPDLEIPTFRATNTDPSAGVGSNQENQRGQQ